jgi:hypothetical protein
MKFVIYRKMDGTGNHHVKQDKPRSEKQIFVFTPEESRAKKCNMT